MNGAPAPGFHKPIRFQFGGWNVPEEYGRDAGLPRGAHRPHPHARRLWPGRHRRAFPDAPGALIDGARTVLSIFPIPTPTRTIRGATTSVPRTELIASIKGVGAEVIFRVGRSEGSNVDPPKDFDRYAEVVKHIVLHYNKGWANGFRYNIRYWEVWNEPDLGRLFWGGTAAQYFDAVREDRARRETGRSPRARRRPRDLAPERHEQPLARRLPRSTCGAKRLPLDFYSWHWYATDSNDPQDVVRIGQNVRARLDRTASAKRSAC